MLFLTWKNYGFVDIVLNFAYFDGVWWQAFPDSLIKLSFSFSTHLLPIKLYDRRTRFCLYFDVFYFCRSFRIIFDDPLLFCWPGIQFGEKLYCGGSLITNEFIITAAHCLKGWVHTAITFVFIIITAHCLKGWGYLLIINEFIITVSQYFKGWFYTAVSNKIQFSSLP